MVNDDDVNAEKQRLQRSKGGGSGTDVVELHGLRKVFPPAQSGHPPKEAVKDLWFGVPAGQCFGFLGVNGAGKTTTLRMITGDEIPTKGTAYLKVTNIYIYI